MKKSERMEIFVEGLESGKHAMGASGNVDPCYLGYFECFNVGRYYEAHDVLEHLWLKEGRGAPDDDFYKGLIQFAGAFVHLKLQQAHPDHPKHGRRLRPAGRLFAMALSNLKSYGDLHQGLDLRIPREIAGHMIRLLEEGGYLVNPWIPGRLPYFPSPVFGQT